MRRIDEEKDRGGEGSMRRRRIEKEEDDRGE